MQRGPGGPGGPGGMKMGPGMMNRMNNQASLQMPMMGPRAQGMGVRGPMSQPGNGLMPQGGSPNMMGLANNAGGMMPGVGPGGAPGGIRAAGGRGTALLITPEQHKYIRYSLHYSSLGEPFDCCRCRPHAGKGGHFAAP
eukprot:5337877-Pyramimonas_sp.AAC.4